MATKKKNATKALPEKGKRSATLDKSTTPAALRQRQRPRRRTCRCRPAALRLPRLRTRRRLPRGSALSMQPRSVERNRPADELPGDDRRHGREGLLDFPRRQNPAGDALLRIVTGDQGKGRTSASKRPNAASSPVPRRSSVCWPTSRHEAPRGASFSLVRVFGAPPLYRTASPSWLSHLPQNLSDSLANCLELPWETVLSGP